MKKVLFASLAAVAMQAAAAQVSAADVDNGPERTESPAEVASEKSAGFWERDTLTGDWGGLRGKMAEQGLTLGATDINEFLSSVTGGQRRGADYMGRTEADIDIDLEKLIGLHGGLAHFSGFNLRGRGLSANTLGNNLLGPSNIEARRTFRLFDAYWDQKFCNDKMSLRLGQIALDDEFLVSQYAANFINSTFGWAALMSANLPSGGPAFPLATPGVRLKWAPSDALYWMTAVTNGDPAGSGSAAPQNRNRAGVTFSTNRDTLAITEAGYSVAADKDSGTVPATYKLGAWYHSGHFNDPHLDSLGQSLAAPATTGVARSHVNDYGAYLVADQWLWTKPGTEDQGLAGFFRAGGTPSDRNLVSYYADAGLNYKGLLEGRDADILGLAVGFAKVSHDAIALDRDNNAANGVLNPVRNFESVIELNYQAVISPWWTLQPDIQYIIHPGGNAASPNSVTSKSMGDALVIGMRSVMKF